MNKKFKLFSVIMLAILFAFSSLLAVGCNEQKVKVEISNDGYWVIDGQKTTTPATGARGARGPQGNTGAAGADGTDGRGILSVDKDSTTKPGTDIYTINYTDGTSYTFELTNGKDGETPKVAINQFGFWEINNQATTIRAQGPSGDDGADGREVEFNVTATHVQWRYKTDDNSEQWTDLIALADLAGASSYLYVRYADNLPTSDADVKTEPSDWIGIYSGTESEAPTDYTAYTWYKIKGADGSNGAPGENGKEIELRTTDTKVQWRYVDPDQGEDENWEDVIALSELKGDDGRGIEFRTTISHIQWRYIDPSQGENDNWYNIIALENLRGASGREVEFRVANGNIQWRYKNDDQGEDENWANVIALSELKGADGQPGENGKQVEFRVAEGNIQWRYVDTNQGENENWANVIALSALKGADGQPGTDGREVELRVANGNIQWRYKNADQGEDENWANVIALADLKGADGNNGTDGREVEFRTTATHIQWRYKNANQGEDENWANVIALADLKGADGNDGTSYYVFVKFADNEPTANADIKDEASDWIGIYTGTSSTAPADYTAYIWYKIRGEAGETPDAPVITIVEGYWYINGENTGVVAIGQDGDAGENGKEVEFRVADGSIQWRHITHDDSEEWEVLIALADIKGADGEPGAPGLNGTPGTNGKEVEFQTTATHIQWRYVGDEVWYNLVALEDIKGNNGQDATFDTHTVTYKFYGTSELFDLTNVPTYDSTFDEAVVNITTKQWLTNMPKMKTEYKKFLLGWYIRGTNVKITNFTPVYDDVVLEPIFDFNSYLKATRATGDHSTLQNVIDEIKGSLGIDLVEYDSRFDTNHTRFVWDSVNDQIYLYLVDEDDIDTLQADITTEPNYVDCFAIYHDTDLELSAADATEVVVDLTDAISSVYLGTTINNAIININKGLDVGENTGIVEVNYTNTNPQTVIIRMNGGTLNIDAPYDVVNKYGSIDNLNIISVASESYHEYGLTSFATIAEGRIVLTEDATIIAVHVVASEVDGSTTGETEFKSIVLTAVGGAVIPAITRDEVTVNAGESRKVVEIQQVSSTTDDNPEVHTAVVYVAKDIQGDESIAVNTVNDNGQEVPLDLSDLTSPEVVVALTIAESMEDAKDAGEVETQLDIRLVSSADELEQALTDGVKNIILRKDITVAEGLVITGEVTIDLNGYTLTSKLTVDEGANLVLMGEGELTASNKSYTIENHGTVTVDANTRGKAPLVTSYEDNGTASLIENGWYNNSDAVGKQATLTINAGTFVGGLNVIKNDSGGVLTVNGGVFLHTGTTSGTATVLNWNIATINGGLFRSENTFTFDNNAVKNDTTSVGQLIINYVNVEGKNAFKKSSAASTIQVNGGTFSNSYMGSGYVINNGLGFVGGWVTGAVNELVACPENYFTLINNITTNTLSFFETLDEVLSRTQAIVIDDNNNTSYYGSFANGLNSVTNGYTIKLNGDYNFNYKPYTYTFDLNGHSAIAYSLGNSVSVITVTDTSAGHTGVLDLNNKKFTAGTIIIEGGRIRNLGAITNGTLIVRGGVFEFDPTPYVDTTVYEVMADDYNDPTEWTVVPANWAAPTYTWSEDNSIVTATRVSNNDSNHIESEVAMATSEITQALSCENDQETTYTAVFTNPVFTTQTKVVVTAEALGHDWSEVEYTWSNDNNQLTATRVCANDANHVETETVNTTREVTLESTCTTAGNTRYTATFTNPAFSTQVKDEAIPLATGHDWGEVVYTWNEDNTEVTATRVCANNTEHVETETVGTSSEVTLNATCITDGNIHYTSNAFTNSAFDIQEKDVVIPALGHAWSEVTYTWSEDNTEVTATRVCGNNAEHVETETVNTTTSVTAATCTTPELTTYTATFTNSAFATQVKSNVETSPALGHDWGTPTYEWTSDNSQVTATIVCNRDGSHVVSETVNTTNTITQSWSCGLPGTTEGAGNDELRTYTATFTNELFTTQTKTNVVTRKAGIHNYVYDTDKGLYVCTVCGDEHAATTTGLDIINDGTILNDGTGCTDEVIFVPNGVTTLSGEAFRDNDTVKYIFFPNTLTTVNGKAFENCNELRALIFPDSVTSIAGWSLFDCPKLEYVKMSDNIEEPKPGDYPNSSHALAEAEFVRDVKLKEIVLPTSPRLLNRTFDGCTSLTAVYIMGPNYRSNQYNNMNSNSTFSNAAKYGYSETYKSADELSQADIDAGMVGYWHWGDNGRPEVW